MGHVQSKHRQSELGVNCLHVKHDRLLNYVIKEKHAYNNGGARYGSLVDFRETTREWEGKTRHTILQQELDKEVWNETRKIPLS